MDGDVTVAVRHSTVNYKEGLAVTGKEPVVRRFLMIPGIDLAGEVVAFADPQFAPGDRVLLNGYGVGEAHYLARVMLDYSEAVITDYMSMVKLDGRWQVVHKVFYIAAQRVAGAA